MKSKNGLEINNRRCFRITRGTQCIIFTFLEVLFPCTLILLWLLHFPEANTQESVISHRGIGITINSWIICVLFALWELISGRHKKVLLRINDEGIGFYQKGFFYEYEWNEIEYLRQSNILGRLILTIKALGREREDRVNLEGCFWTFIPVRIAIRHFSKGQIKYFTRHQWKEHKKSITTTE